MKRIKRIHYTGNKKKHYRFKESNANSVPGYQGHFEIDMETIEVTPTLFSPSSDTYIKDIHPNKRRTKMFEFLEGLYNDLQRYYLVKQKWFYAIWNKVHTLESCFGLIEVDIKDLTLNSHNLSRERCIEFKGQKYKLPSYLGTTYMSSMPAIAKANGVDYVYKAAPGRYVFLVPIEIAATTSVWWLNDIHETKEHYEILRNLQIELFGFDQHIKNFKT